MRRQRFSLYCLEDGDEYLGDVIADYYYANKTTVTAASSAARRGPGPTPPPRASAAASTAQSPLAQRTKLRGTLRLAGRAVLFEPDDARIPIFTFRYKDIVKSQEDDITFVTESDLSVACASGAQAASPKSSGLPLQSIVGAGSPIGGATASAPVQSPFASAANYFVIRCQQVYTQCTNGDLHPFGTEPPTKSRGEHIFSFPFHNNAATFLDQINMLVAVERTTNRGHEKQAIVRRLVELRQKEVPFGLTLLRSHSERILHEVTGSRIAPLTSEPGRLVVSSKCLYFQATFPISATGVEVIALSDIRRVERRRIHFRDVGLELATLNDRVQLFTFSTREARESLFRVLGGHPLLERLAVNTLSNMTQKWQAGELSTFDYLMFLNWASGRSLNDLAQYPVLPWVIADYVSDTIELDDPRIYRNLRKPIGALNDARLRTFRERAKNLKEILGQEPYLYGTHYSNPAYVTYFLVRTKPEYMLVLHNGKLDNGSRIFDSIPDAFSSVLTGPTDVKELIPEFFYGDGDFLRRCNIDLGFKTDGTNVRREVQLPPWADDDPAKFVRLNREALEGEVCSAMIHHWIDLVFGYKQQGDEAWKADNVFHPYSYESCIASLGQIKDDVERLAIETHIKEFGQTPKQLFTGPHPARIAKRTPPRCISLATFMPPDSENLEESLNVAVAAGEDGCGRAPSSMASLRRSFGRDEIPPQQQGERAPPALAASSRHHDPTDTGATFEGECETSSSSASDAGSRRDEDVSGSDNEGGDDAAASPPSSPSPPPGPTLKEVTDMLAQLVDRRPDSDPSDSNNNDSRSNAANLPQAQHLDLGSDHLPSPTASGRPGASPAGRHGGGHPPHQQQSLDSPLSPLAGATAAGLAFSKAFRAQTKAVDALAFAFVTDNATWLLDHHGLPRLPVLICSDAQGTLSFIDVVTKKKLHSIVDLFGRSSIAALDMYVSNMLYDGSEACLLVGSSTGTIFTVSVEHCCVDEDREVTSSFLTCFKCRGQWAVTGGRDGSASVWKMSKKQGAIVNQPCLDPVHQVDMCDPIACVDVSKNGRYVAVVAVDGEVCIVDTQEDFAERRFTVVADLAHRGGGGASAAATSAASGSSASSSGTPGVVFCGFVEEHLCIVTRTHVANYGMDGEVWSLFRLPTTSPAAFASLGRGGCVSPDQLCVATASGELWIITTANGKPISRAQVDASELVGGAGGGGAAVISAMWVAPEHVILGDSAGMIHLLSFLGED